MQRAAVQVVVGGEEKNQPKPLSSENKSDHSVAGLKHQTPNICCAYPSLRVCHVITPRKRHRIISNSQTRQGEVRVRGVGVEGITHTLSIQPGRSPGTGGLLGWPFTWNRRSVGPETLRCYLRTESQSTVQLHKQDCIKVFHTFPTAQYLIPTDSQGLHQSVSHSSYSTILNTNLQSRTASKCFTHLLQHNT